MSPQRAHDPGPTDLFADPLLGRVKAGVSINSGARAVVDEAPHTTAWRLRLVDSQVTSTGVIIATYAPAKG